MLGTSLYAYIIGFTRNVTTHYSDLYIKPSLNSKLSLNPTSYIRVPQTHADQILIRRVVQLRELDVSILGGGLTDSYKGCRRVYIRL